MAAGRRGGQPSDTDCFLATTGGVELDSWRARGLEGRGKDIFATHGDTTDVDCEGGV